MKNYSFQEDIALTKELLNLTLEDIASMTGASLPSVKRWSTGSTRPSEANLSAFYDAAFKKGMRINAVKAQLHKEELENEKRILLFHGAKREVEGAPSLEHSKVNNDFGKGFYCGENFEQAAMFVAGYEHSSVYLFGFNDKGLKAQQYTVNQDWMLTIAWYRGRLKEYAENERIKALIKKVEKVDYLITPIADNRMYETIDQFIDGIITDVQCQHCLSATNLGKQYVFRTEKALKQVEELERCFLSPSEKAHYTEAHEVEAAIGADKVRTALKRYRGQGKYIDEVLS